MLKTKCFQLGNAFHTKLLISIMHSLHKYNIYYSQVMLLLLTTQIQRMNLQEEKYEVKK